MAILNLYISIISAIDSAVDNEIHQQQRRIARSSRLFGDNLKKAAIWPPWFYSETVFNNRVIPLLALLLSQTVVYFDHLGVDIFLIIF